MIDEVRGNKNSFPPIEMRNICSEHHSSGHLKNVFVFSLSHPISLRGVWTWTLMKYAMFREMVSEIMGKIFWTIISSKNMNKSFKCIQNEFVKHFESVIGLWLFSHKIDPTLAWSSIKIINQREPKILRCLAGPQISLWIKWKGFNGL